LTIRSKTLVVVLLLVGASYALLAWVLAGRIRSDFARLEQREAQRNMERVNQAVLASVDALCEKLIDWAVWDDTYAFMSDRNKEYVESNIVETSFTGLKLNLLLFFGSDGGLVLGQAFDEADRMAAALPAGLMAARFGSESPLIAFLAINDSKRGVLVGEGHPPLLFCSQPIVKSSGLGPSRGTMVFGAWLTEARQRNLEKLTRLSLSFRTSGPPAAPPAAPGSGFPIAAESEDVLAGLATFPDPGGRGALVVQASLPREVHREARRTLAAVMLALAIVGGVLGAATLLLLEILVLRRLAAMSAAVKGITDRFEFEARVDDSGSDEISRLGRSVNGLLAAMEQATSSGDAADGGRDP